MPGFLNLFEKRFLLVYLNLKLGSSLKIFSQFSLFTATHSPTEPEVIAFILYSFQIIIIFLSGPTFKIYIFSSLASSDPLSHVFSFTEDPEA